MKRIDATAHEFEVMLLFDVSALFCGRRIDKATIPQGVFAYEIQYDGEGIPICMADKIDTNYFGGTALTLEQIELNEYNCRLMNDSDIIIHPDYDFMKLDEFLTVFKQGDCCIQEINCLNKEENMPVLSM